MLAANLHPSVFISSTIKEFRDFRSAIGYILRTQEFTVHQSEAEDFIVRGDRSAAEECFANIRESDYYVLIVGNTRGSLYEEGVSITRQEYRTARDAFRSKGRPRLFLYLREDAEKALLNGVDPLKAGIDDPAHLRSFIDEIQQQENKNIPSFLVRFSDFERLMNSLAIRMNLGRNLSEKLIRHSLLSELLSNLALMSLRHGTSAFPVHGFISKVAEQIPISPESLERNALIPIKDDQLPFLSRFSLTGRIGGEELKTRAIEDALDNGVFLEFNPADGSLRESSAHGALQQTLEDIWALKRDATSPGPIKWDEDISKAISERSVGQPNSLRIPSAVLALAFGYCNRMENIFRAHLALCQFLLGRSQELPTYDRRPISALGDEEERQIHAERVSAEEIRRLIENDIWPFGKRTPQELFGKTREEQVKKVLNSMSATLNKLGIDASEREDALEEAAKYYLDHDTASPGQGIEDRRVG